MWAVLAGHDKKHRPDLFVEYQTMRKGWVRQPRHWPPPRIRAAHPSETIRHSRETRPAESRSRGAVQLRDGTTTPDHHRQAVLRQLPEDSGSEW